MQCKTGEDQRRIEMAGVVRNDDVRLFSEFRFESLDAHRMETLEIEAYPNVQKGSQQNGEEAVAD
jgi:hypothetical protein